MTSPSILVTPRRPALLCGLDNTVDLLVRVQAPPRPATTSERPPLNLAIVLDRSGSMSGRPLEEARRCAAMIVDRLGRSDRAALVVYDHGVNVLVAATPATERTVFHTAIAGISEGGMTNLHGGWLHGARAMAPAERNATTRVLLLSDGQANQGITAPEEIARQCAEQADAGITTSTYGLGTHFNEELMIAMANAGRGNSYYGETAEDLMDPFAEEFDLLAALCARQISVTTDLHEAVAVTVLNRYAKDHHGRYRLPDLAYDGESWAVIRLTVPKAIAGAGDGADITLGAVTVGYADLDGRHHELAPVAVALPSLPAAAFAAITEADIVVRRVRELKAANIQDRAQSAARRGDWDEVRRLLQRARENATNNEWLGQVVAKLERLAAQADEAMFSKEALYASRKMRARLADSDESAPGMRASYLRRKAEQGKAAPHE